MQSKLRRVREYEGEDEQLRKQTASGLWNKNMRSSENLDYEDKAEMKKLTDAIREQVSVAARRQLRACTFFLRGGTSTVCDVDASALR